MNESIPLQIRVNEELLIDAGRYHYGRHVDYCGPVIFVEPPVIPMHLQLVHYLESKPVPPIPRCWRIDETRAMVSFCLRWGSYFSWLADSSRPFKVDIKNEDISHIVDDEMMRMNIEVSAAIEWWLQLLGSNYERYWELVHRILTYLPQVGPKTVKRLPKGEMLLNLTHPIYVQLCDERKQSYPAEYLQQANQHGIRIIANTFALHGWRNGTIEDVHAGKFNGYPLERRRICAEDEKKVIVQMQNVMYDALKIVDILKYDNAWPPAESRVLPFMIRSFHPSGWSRTLQSCQMILPV